MTRRVLLLVALTAVLAVPTVALADGGGNPAAGASGARAGKARVVDRFAARLDRRFHTFSGRCLVANPPEKCTKAARRLVKQLDVLQRVLHKAEDTIKTKCAAASPPARCSSAGDVTQKIDDLLAKIASDEAAIKAAFPNTASA